MLSILLDERGGGVSSVDKKLGLELSSVLPTAVAKLKAVSSVALEKLKDSARNDFTAKKCSIVVNFTYLNDGFW